MRSLVLILVVTFSLNLSVGVQGKQTVNPSSQPKREIAITFDDLPGIIFHRQNNLRALEIISTQLMTTLVKERVPAIGFVNEHMLYVRGQTDARIAILRMWLDSGMSLGNHTFSHLKFYDTPLNVYMDDVIRGDVVTRELMRERTSGSLYFRHPQTNTGPTKEAKDKFEAFLIERGYRIAPFTIENSDFVFNKAYEDARARKDFELAARIKDSYLDYLDAMCRYFEERSRQVVGYEVKQILLTHVNQLNADALSELIKRLRSRGYNFITLDAALQDKAYNIKDDYVGPMGISWVHRWTVSLGQEMNMKDEPDVPKFVLDLYKARQSADE